MALKLKKTAKIEPIDITPNWRSLIDILVEKAAKGDQSCRDELYRLADIVDEFNQTIQNFSGAKEDFKRAFSKLKKHT